jgi:hypothetical protein
MAADWKTTLGSHKTIRGQATQDGVAIDDMSGWTDPKIRLITPSGEELLFDATLSAEGVFSYLLKPDDYDEKGTYMVKFRADSPTGQTHYFPEGKDAELFVDD